MSMELSQDGRQSEAKAERKFAQLANGEAVSVEGTEQSAQTADQMRGGLTERVYLPEVYLVLFLESPGRCTAGPSTEEQ